MSEQRPREIEMTEMGSSVPKGPVTDPSGEKAQKSNPESAPAKIEMTEMGKPAARQSVIIPKLDAQYQTYMVQGLSREQSQAIHDKYHDEYTAAHDKWEQSLHSPFARFRQGSIQEKLDARNEVVGRERKELLKASLENSKEQPYAVVFKSELEDLAYNDKIAGQWKEVNKLEGKLFKSGPEKAKIKELREEIKNSNKEHIQAKKKRVAELLPAGKQLQDLSEADKYELAYLKSVLKTEKIINEAEARGEKWTMEEGTASKTSSKSASKQQIKVSWNPVLPVGILLITMLILLAVFNVIGALAAIIAIGLIGGGVALFGEFPKFERVPSPENQASAEQQPNQIPEDTPLEISLDDLDLDHSSDLSAEQQAKAEPKEENNEANANKDAKNDAVNPEAEKPAAVGEAKVDGEAPKAEQQSQFSWASNAKPEEQQGLAAQGVEHQASADPQPSAPSQNPSAAPSASPSSEQPAPPSTNKDAEVVNKSQMEPEPSASSKPSSDDSSKQPLEPALQPQHGWASGLAAKQAEAKVESDNAVRAGMN